MISMPTIAEPVRPTGASRAQQRRQAARRAIVWGGFLFASLQLVMTLSSETWLPELRDPPFWTKVRRFQERLESAPARPLSVVMLGSSCTAYGFRGQVFAERISAELGRPVVAFNFGCYGRGPLSSLLHLERLLEKGLKPDVVLVEVFPLMFPGRTAVHDANPAALSVGELDTVRRFNNSKRLEEECWQATLAPVSGRRNALVSRLAPRLLPADAQVQWWTNMDDSGWIPRETPFVAVAQRDYRRARTQWAQMLRRCSTTGQSAQALEALIELARRNDIQVALVSAPEGTVLRSVYPANLPSLVRTMLDDLGRKHDVPVVHAREWLDEAAFSDSFHLYPEGAATFTARLAHELRPQLFGKMGRGVGG